ncbi:hypothetical protein PAI11_31410 [Patulibacter medicamentivorans]|jgi:hypothetical protein|uniref:Uncharacterized protein n=1 Tax=Patulibacter medicamentivorans TaxID=1097667 RepID=H0E8I0_9ACTN|nr:hypothetical protein [Patulibacter medicamentivorans]EHN09980.1 hypothetical protein PAI11_31410 [Patulibacter medicamentivorans]
MAAPSGVSFILVSTLIVFAVVAALVLLGLFWPGNGSAQLDWRPSRSPEQAAMDEIDDVQQMLQATNERRRLRGAPELTEEDLEARVQEDRQAMAEWIARRDALERPDAGGER